MAKLEPTGHLADLMAARCAVPFEYLGQHPGPEGKGLVIRVWQPDVESLTVIDYLTDSEIGAMTRLGDSDLFELSMPRRSKRFPYKLKGMRQGQPVEFVDAYQFGEYLNPKPDWDRDRLYRHLGAHPIEISLSAKVGVKGVRFSVYAPAARAVSVTGDFNEWDGRRNPMQATHDGVWRLFLPGLEPGALYKFEVKGPAGDMLPRKSDPFSYYLEQAPANASIVFAQDGYEWADEVWMEKRSGALDRPLSVYEVHAGSWRRKSGRSLSYRELADELIPYVVEMGYTHIEFLPLSEHPFSGSWGYQPVGMFAPTSRFGSPDDLKYLIDRCHRSNIGVILDWVPAHFPEDEHGLANFDGTPLFEHPDPKRGWHPDWNTHIYDYGKKFVTDFLVSSAMFWVEEYHIDGLRVDAVASMLYLDYSRDDGAWEPNMFGGNEHLEAIDFIKRFNETIYSAHPNVMTIAEESTAWPGVSKPTYDNGLGFGYKWNMGWMHDTLSYLSRDPIHRKYHHNEITFSLVYAFDEHFVLPLSHDEVVHGKGSLVGKMAGDEWQKFANLRMYYAFMYAHPGKKTLFMGAELAQVREWNHDDQLDWSLLEDPKHGGVHRLVGDLNHLYRLQPSLFEVDYSEDGFQWIDHDDAEGGVLSFIRWAHDKRDHVVVVCNLTPVVREGYRIGVPSAARYKEVLNTDSSHYAGTNVGNDGAVSADPTPQHGFDQSAVFRLPPLATLYLKREDS